MSEEHGGTQSTEMLNMRTSDHVAREETKCAYLLVKWDGSYLLMLGWGSEGVETPRGRMTATP